MNNMALGSNPKHHQLLLKFGSAKVWPLLKMASDRNFCLFTPYRLRSLVKIILAHPRVLVIENE